MRERAGFTGGFLMRPDMAPEYQAASERRVCPRAISRVQV